jgi:hypothetical protein
MGHIAWGVTSVLLIFVSYRSSAYLRVIRLIVFVSQLTAVLHAGSFVSCHNFVSLCLCFNKRSSLSRSLFMSESVTLLVDSLYAEAIEAVKQRAALSAFTPEWISILGEVTTVPRGRIFIRLPPAITRRHAIQWASGLTFLSDDSIAPVALWKAPTLTSVLGLGPLSILSKRFPSRS